MICPRIIETIRLDSSNLPPRFLPLVKQDQLPHDVASCPRPQQNSAKHNKQDSFQPLSIARVHDPRSNPLHGWRHDLLAFRFKIKIHRDEQSQQSEKDQAQQEASQGLNEGSEDSDVPSSL